MNTLQDSDGVTIVRTTAPQAGEHLVAYVRRITENIKGTFQHDERSGTWYEIREIEGVKAIYYCGTGSQPTAGILWSYSVNLPHDQAMKWGKEGGMW